MGGPYPSDLNLWLAALNNVADTELSLKSSLAAWDAPLKKPSHGVLLRTAYKPGSVNMSTVSVNAKPTVSAKI